MQLHVTRLKLTQFGHWRQSIRIATKNRLRVNCYRMLRNAGKTVDRMTIWFGNVARAALPVGPG